MKDLFSGIYKGRKVLVTGHTGFKGSWLSLWLEKLGAQVAGYSLAPNTNPSHFEILRDQNVLKMESTIGDLRDREHLASCVRNFQPDVVFHLAAQPLVRQSYDDPCETYETNVMGTCYLLEAVREVPSCRAIVGITTDKVYANKEWPWGYRESDRLGGSDPYSNSKSCSELVFFSYRKSFFSPQEFGQSHHTLIATARAGNVIGGGDWCKDRIVTDIVSSALNQRPLEIRSPHAIRPWQHVLEPLSGYLLLGEKLLKREQAIAREWNFGPSSRDCIPVEEIVRRAQEFWPGLDYQVQAAGSLYKETRTLKLDCSLAESDLGWSPALTVDQALEMTFSWFQQFSSGGELLTEKQLQDYALSQ